jgi:lysine-specific metallo-endopeptidase family protein
MSYRLLRVQVGVLLLLMSASIGLAEEPPCTGNELSVAKASMADAKRALDQAISATKSTQKSDADRLNTWLGVRSSADAEKVRATLERTRAFVDGATFLCAVKTDIKIGDVYAYVRPTNSFVIVLGHFFFAAKDTGFSSKLGILIHEMTHFTIAGATKDPKIYGPEEAKRLAASSPTSAQQNAENFEYYVEALIFGL